MSLLYHREIFFNKIRQSAGNKWYCTTMLDIMFEGKAAYIGEQDGDTTCIQDFTYQVQVCLDDSHAKGLGRVLVATMALLLPQVGGSKALYVVEHVEERIAEELGQDERANHYAKFACSQAIYLRWIRDGTLF